MPYVLLISSLKNIVFSHLVTFQGQFVLFLEVFFLTFSYQLFFFFFFGWLNPDFLAKKLKESLFLDEAQLYTIFFLVNFSISK